MAFKIFALVLAVVIGVSHTLPARFDPDDIEMVDPVGALDDYADSPPFGFPDFSLPDFSAIQDYINSVRASIAAAIAGASPVGKGNATSETRIIDGNRVTINRTEYNENGVHVVVKNVEVQPVSGESTERTNQSGTSGTSGSSGSPDSAGSTTATQAIRTTSAATAATLATPTRPREDIETFAEGNNEPAQSRIYDNLENLETFDIDEMDFRPNNNFDLETFDILPIERDLTNDINVNKMAKRHYNHYNDEDVEEFEVNAINDNDKTKQQLKQGQAGRDVEDVEAVEEVLHDLSGDTYVNDLLAHKMEAEWKHREREWEDYQPRPIAYNTYAVSDHDDVGGLSGYRDLSRDTYVNEVAAQRGVPKNPDAEEFDVEMVHPVFVANDALRKRHS